MVKPTPNACRRLSEICSWTSPARIAEAARSSAPAHVVAARSAEHHRGAVSQREMPSCHPLGLAHTESSNEWAHDIRNQPARRGSNPRRLTSAARLPPASDSADRVPSSGGREILPCSANFHAHLTHRARCVRETQTRYEHLLHHRSHRRRHRRFEAHWTLVRSRVL